MATTVTYEPLKLLLTTEGETKEYLLEFDENSVATFARISEQSAPQLIKAALKKHHPLESTEDFAKRAWQSLALYTESDDAKYTVNDIIERLYNLFDQAADEKAKNTEPAEIEIKKDNSVVVTVDGKKYTLCFNRKTIKKISNMGFPFEDITDRFKRVCVIPQLIAFALKANLENYSSKLPTTIYNAMWATTFNPETEELCGEALSALIMNFSEVLESGSKNSSAAVVM